VQKLKNTLYRPVIASSFKDFIVCFPNAVIVLITIIIKYLGQFVVIAFGYITINGLTS